MLKPLRLNWLKFTLQARVFARAKVNRLVWQGCCLRVYVIQSVDKRLLQALFLASKFKDFAIFYHQNFISDETLLWKMRA